MQESPVCVSVCLSIHLSSCHCMHFVMKCLRMAKKVLDSLELEFQALVSQLLWVLEIKLRFFARAILPAPKITFFRYITVLTEITAFSCFCNLFPREEHIALDTWP